MEKCSESLSVFSCNANTVSYYPVVVFLKFNEGNFLDKNDKLMKVNGFLV